VKNDSAITVDRRTINFVKSVEHKNQMRDSEKETFNFFPLRKKKKIPTELYVKISTPGVLILPSHTLIQLVGSDTQTFWIHLFVDQEKRAVGFFISREFKGKEPSIRLVKPQQIKFGNPFAAISIKTFTNSLEDLYLPTPKLVLKKYKDGLLGPELYYVRVPKGKKIDKNDNVNETRLS